MYYGPSLNLKFVKMCRESSPHKVNYSPKVLADTLLKTTNENTFLLLSCRHSLLLLCRKVILGTMCQCTDKSSTQIIIRYCLKLVPRLFDFREKMECLMEHNNANLKLFATLDAIKNRFCLRFNRKKALIGSLMLIWQLVVVDFVSCLSRV